MVDEGLAGGSGRLEPGESLLVYTDGLPDAMDAGDLAFGTDRIRAALEAGPDADPSEILDRVERAVADHVGPIPPHDDINLVLVQHPAP